MTSRPPHRFSEICHASGAATNLRDAKAALRQRAKQHRNSLAPAVRRAASEYACRRLADLAEVRQAQIVAAFAARESEISADRFIIDTLAAGSATVVLPRVAGRHLTFHQIRSLEELVVSGHGIREPQSNAVLVPPRDIDLFIVPGLAFDRYGGRIGWGAGYYDRTLAANPHAERVGFLFAEQLVTCVPRDDSDQLMTVLCTDSATIRVSRQLGVDDDPRFVEEREPGIPST